MHSLANLRDSFEPVAAQNRMHCEIILEVEIRYHLGDLLTVGLVANMHHQKQTVCFMSHTCVGLRDLPGAVAIKR